MWAKSAPHIDILPPFGWEIISTINNKLINQEFEFVQTSRKLKANQIPMTQEVYDKVLNLRHKREALRLTRKQMAELTGRKATSIQIMERGEFLGVSQELMKYIEAVEQLEREGFTSEAIVA